MDTKQTLNIIDKHFNTFEVLGVANNKDLILLLYLMFIDEYYEYNRGISMEFPDDADSGLTDCLVKTLNNVLNHFKENYNILNGIELDYLPTKNHWIVFVDGEYPEPEPQPEPTEPYIEDNILNVEGNVFNNILSVEGDVNEHNLYL